MWKWFVDLLEGRKERKSMKIGDLFFHFSKDPFTKWNDISTCICIRIIDMRKNFVQYEHILIYGMWTKERRPCSIGKHCFGSNFRKNKQLEEKIRKSIENEKNY